MGKTNNRDCIKRLGLLDILGLHSLLLMLVLGVPAVADGQDTYNQIDEMGNITQRSSNGNFNKHNNDTTSNKEAPKGYFVWTIDRKFGDVRPTVPDTISHLFPNTTFNHGVYGEYNTTGSNYTARLSRIFINRNEASPFIFTQPYDFFLTEPDQYLFLNTLSPLANVTYDNCGDKQNGEDRLGVKYGVNINKRSGVGFSLNYDYARGYFSSQNISHFGGTLYGYYQGDRYQMHALFSAVHQKATENGGIQNDEYVVHPESFSQDFAENEIPTVLSENWNRNDHQHLFFSQRYNVGFYRRVPLTEEEIKARKFAAESKKENEEKKKREAGEKGLKPNERGEASGRPVGAPIGKADNAPKGRPDGARIVGKEPAADSLGTHFGDSTRIQVENQAMMDSLNREKAIEDSLDATTKKVYVPVTSFIHTLELNNNERIYQSYQTPESYYLERYYEKGEKYSNDSIYDPSRMLQIKNTLGIALLEGFNKYMKAGLKAFVTHDYRRYRMYNTPDDIGTVPMGTWPENNVSIGGLINKTQGRTLHFNLMAETWLVGEESGQLKLDFQTDLNFALFGDTVRLAAKAYFHRLHPSFFHRHYHSKNLWWDNDDLSKETRLRLEGLFSYEKTDTRLRVAIEEVKNYTYFAMAYDASTTGRTNLTAEVKQESPNINILTAQLQQNFRLGPLNWENVLTYQNSSNESVLPLPTWNFFTNLYLKFKIARVLGVELGAYATIFSKYYAPDFCPQINQFAIQQTEASRIELGGYPFVDVYANLMLKGVRFFVMMSHVNAGSGNGMQFLTPHYPTNNSVLHFGVSWNFFN